MKTSLRISLVFASALATSLLLAVPQANATVIATWAGNYGTSPLVMPTPTSSTDGGGRTVLTYGYDFNTAITPASGYSGPQIYGAAQSVSTSATPEPLVVTRTLDGSGTASKIDFQTDNIAYQLTALVYFKPSVSGTISFDSSSSISTPLQASFTPAGPYTQTGRAAVLNNRLWYLSNTSVNAQGVTTLSITDASAEMWGLWGDGNPTGELLPNQPSTYNTAGSTFTNIQAVGVWLQGGATASLNAGFVANATVTVPEPSTYAMILAAGGIGLTMVLRRRARR